MYSSGDLWQQLLDKEKEKVRELEEKYADRMREKGVSVIHVHATTYLHDGPLLKRCIDNNKHMK